MIHRVCLRVGEHVQGRIQGEGAGGAHPPPPDLRFSNTTGTLQKKKNYVVYWC